MFVDEQKIQTEITSSEDEVVVKRTFHAATACSANDPSDFAEMTKWVLNNATGPMRALECT